MPRLYFILSNLMIVSLLSGCAGKPAIAKSLDNNQLAAETAPAEVVSSVPPADCPVTTPQAPPFTPPAPYSPTSPFPNDFWYGISSLWTLLPTSGKWATLPYDGTGYGQKVFWWREGYVWTDEPEPDLIVTGERLDAEAPSFHASKATNAYASDIGSAMLVGVDFPTLGCWKVTGKFNDAELSFVILVAP